MKGDKLLIKKEHRQIASASLIDSLCQKIQEREGNYAITIAGESGSGKSEISKILATKLYQRNIKSIILQQDDYFIYPPQTNARVRQKDISWVGPGEVKLDLLDQHLADFLAEKQEIEKPLVIFRQNCFMTEKIKIGHAKVVIAEGTYTTLLRNAHCHIFIDRDYNETRKARIERDREEQDEFLERVLKIEHEIISRHKAHADIIIQNDYSVEGRVP